jgi:hypothetical protein
MKLPQALCAIAFIIGLGAAAAQEPAAPAAQAPAVSTDAAPSQAALPETAAPPANPTSSTPAAPEKKTYTIPAGTKVLLQLKSGINSKSAKAGDGVYLSSIFPVVVGNHVLLPSGMYVQGVVDRVERAGHVKGKAQVDMHFTSMIFPNGTLVEIPGVVNSVPGTTKQKVKGDEEGTIEQDSNKTRNLGTAAEIALPAGTTVGAIGGASSGHLGAGIGAGLGGGLAAMALATVFTRGADVNLEAGTQVEMVLQRPLVLEEDNLTGGTGRGEAPALAPAANQQKALEKPNRTRVMCPLGGLSCR